MVRVDERSDVGSGVLLITLDRPDRRNAVDHETLLALLEAQRAAVDARVVVLTGAPPAFSAGADLNGVDQDAFAADLARVLQGFTALTAPVLASIDGPALGAGAQLAAVSDLRVATATSVIGVPAARLGIAIDHWTIRRLRSQFGDSITRAMLLAAETYTGEALYQSGGVHRVGDLDAALEWAARISSLAPLSIAAHKLGLESTVEPPSRDADVDTARVRAWGSEDAAEGRRAFMEKRQPEFRGR